jgi:hypothetical protein
MNNRRNIKPIKYVGPAAIYSPDVIDLIREDLSRGRPKKAAEKSSKKSKK